MKPFKNISQIDDQTCKLLLYGEIGTDEGCISSANFVQMLDWCAEAYQKCKVHVNSNGGDVVEGIAIYNALSTNPMDIEIYIDGVACSIAAVDVMCGRKVFMSKYSRLMFHSVTGNACGTIEDMKNYIVLAESFQNTVADMISKKTGQSIEEVISKYFDGCDHWLTATEALALGIIDGIYDGVPVVLPDTESDPAALYNLFNNKLKIEPMDFKNLFARLKLRDNATEPEAITAVDQLEAENASLKNKNQAQETEIADLKNKLAQKENAEAAAFEAEVETTLANAVTEGRIQEAQKPHFKAILKADKTNGLAILNGLPKAKRLINNINNDGDGDTEERVKWTFDDYQKKDPVALQNMKANEPEKFNKLLKAHTKRN